MEPANTPTKPKIGVGLRLVQAVFALTVLGAYLSAARLNPSDFTYDFSLVRALATVVLSVLSIWFIQRRVRAARPFVAVSCVIMIACLLIDYFLFGCGPDIEAVLGQGLSRTALFVQAALWAAIALYMLVSKQVKSTLWLRLDRPDYYAVHLPQTAPLRERIRTWCFWRDLAIYFIAFSFLGHWAEMLFCLLIAAGVFMGDFDLSNAMLWEQWLFPFSAEGIAMALIVLVLAPLKNKLMRRFDGHVAIVLPITFIAIAVACTSVDFLTGITANYDYHLWDYRDLPFNFMGQVCLQNSLVYSIAATLILWVFYPLMDRGMAALPYWLANAIFWGFAAAYGFLALLHFMYLSPTAWVFG